MLARSLRAATPLRAAALRPAMGALAPAANALVPMLYGAGTTSERRDSMSTQPVPRGSPIKMGGLAVDNLAGSSTVQGVEYALTGLDRLVNWARKSSMWPMTFGLA